MSVLKISPPVKLIVSLLSRNVGLIGKCIGILAEEYGRPDFISELFDFNYTDYYEEEMGKELKRRFVSFESLIMPDVLPEVKRRMNELEDRWRVGEKRQINIDPGYISEGHLILATGKPYAHRPYIGKGVWADLTLIFQHGEFRGLPWTYPDYASSTVRRMLGGIRRKYLEQLRWLRS
ncbi:MAG: DUF4416 family protein [Syntrophales bacterium]|nr:DUF4416 family protein [Syntrophales bacterium]